MSASSNAHNQDENEDGPPVAPDGPIKKPRRRSRCSTFNASTFAAWSQTMGRIGRAIVTVVRIVHIFVIYHDHS